MAKLTSRGFTDAKVEKNKDAVLIHLSNEESLIQVIKDSVSQRGSYLSSFTCPCFR